MSSASSAVGSIDDFMAQHQQKQREESSATQSMDGNTLDPSNPLNFLLQSVGTFSNTDSSSSSFGGEDSSSSFGGASPAPDWSQFTNLWPQDPSAPSAGVSDLKFDPSSMDFDFSLPMELDFNSSMAIEPSALHFDSTKILPSSDSTANIFAPHHIPRHSQSSGDDLSSMSFSEDMMFTQFMDGMLHPSSANTHPLGERRMSITSSSSSSGASLSPILDHSAAVQPSSNTNNSMEDSPPQNDPFSEVFDAMMNSVGEEQQEQKVEGTLDPADELAQRVRQTAGVTLAVPVAGQGQSVQSFGGSTSPKLPIPRNPSNTPQTIYPQPPTSTSNTSSISGSPSPPTSANTSPSAASSPNPTSNLVSLPPSDPSSANATLAPASTLSGTSATASAAAPGTTTVIGGRPKTSHTTIERRYRTNLNARIISLKNAVPALRVLDQKKNKDKSSDLIEDGLEGGEEVKEKDVVDERGIVDGVKVARKISKANVLGKATEYIRVLKRREQRLKHEQQGLRSLISGLVGGPALLKEWEREWTAKFGGPERDELEYENANGRGGMSDDDDDGDSDDGDEEEKTRARKKPKVVKEKKETVKKEKVAKDKMPTTSTATGTGQPEKRKRGRPKKNVAPAMVQSESFVAQQQQQIVFESGTGNVVVPPQAQAPPQPQQPQYLLAVFAFFSFFSSPLTSSTSSASTHHTHSGVVLNSPFPASAVHIPSPSSSTGSGLGFGWQEFVQVFHLLVSALVFFSIVLPWLPSSIRRFTKFLPFGPVVHQGNADATLPTPPPSPTSSSSTSSVSESESTSKAVKRPRSLSFPGTDTFNRLAFIDALSLASRASPTAADEASRLREALGIKEGLLGLVGALGGGAMGKIVRAVSGGGLSGKTGRGRGIERMQLEQRAWVRLGELVALEPNTPFATRLLTYYGMTTHTSAFAASTNDLITLALIVYPLSKSRAHSLWNKAASRAKAKNIAATAATSIRAYERLVVDNMGIEEARERIAGLWVGPATSNSSVSKDMDKDRMKLDNEFDAVLGADRDVGADGDADGKKGQECRFPDFEKYSPLSVLATLLIRERVRKHAALLFVRSVPGALEQQRQQEDAPVIYDPKKEILEERELKECVEAGVELGGRAKELCVLLEKIGQPSFVRHEEVLTFDSGSSSSSSSSGNGSLDVDVEEAELRTLMSAIVLYRRLFPSAVLSSSSAGHGVSVMLSPPPSPSKRNAKLRTALRVALDSEVFDGIGLAGVEGAAASMGCGSASAGGGAALGLSGELDEARDRVVDMLMEVQGQGRSGSRRV